MFFPNFQTVLRQPQEYLEKLSWLQSPLNKVFYVGEVLPILLDWVKARRYLARGDVFAVLKKDGVLIKETIIGKCLPVLHDCCIICISSVLVS